jgi:hypothetical protein
MSSTHAQVAEAVKVQLNEAAATGVFAERFVARRLYLTTQDLPEVVGDQVNVIVAAFRSEREALSRRCGQKDVTVHVGVFKKLPAGTNPTSEDANGVLDALSNLAESIADFFGPGMTAGDAQWIRTTNEPIYDPDQLHELNLFASLVAVTFKTDTTPYRNR